jgi:uncharacterized membrane protein
LSQWHVMTGRPHSSVSPDDVIRAGLYHAAFVAKIVGDYATARRHAWNAVQRDTFVWASWRLLGVAMVGKMGLFFRQLLSHA